MQRFQLSNIQLAMLVNSNNTHNVPPTPQKPLITLATPQQPLLMLQLYPKLCIILAATHRTHLQQPIKLNLFNNSLETTQSILSTPQQRLQFYSNSLETSQNLKTTKPPTKILRNHSEHLSNPLETTQTQNSRNHSQLSSNFLKIAQNLGNSLATTQNVLTTQKL